MSTGPFNDSATRSTSQTRWIFFRAFANKKTQGMEIGGGLSIPEIEAKIAEITTTPAGTVAYWVGEIGQDKHAAWADARKAELQYLTPQEIQALRKIEYDKSMNQILTMLVAISKDIKAAQSQPQHP